MLVHMFLHSFVDISRKIAPVLVALEESVPRVSGHVHLQFPLPREACLAQLTHERPDILVDGLIVSFKIAAVLVGVIAERTLEGTIVRVDEHVLLEGYFGAELLEAD